MYDLSDLSSIGVNASVKVYGKGKTEITVAIFDKAFERKVVGLVQSELFPVLIPIVLRENGEEELEFASLGMSKDGKIPSINFYEMYQGDLQVCTEEVVTIIFHELGHLHNGDADDITLSSEAEDEMRIKECMNHRVSEKEIRADLFAVDYLGADTVVAGLAQLINRTKEYLDCENADIAIQEIEQRIKIIQERKIGI